jgi:putative protease
VTDDELKDVQKLIHRLYEIGVDALIVQDMAIVKMAIEKKIPPIPLHISTQCDNRDEGKIQFFSKMGLPRVVLARELSIEKIKRIIEQNPDLEIETFIHGALCVSYSGQCYFSHSIGGRSANRGECAQPCRKKYSLEDDCGNVLIKDKHLLSLKDFNVANHLRALVDVGVKSFKIEGRLKEEDYVKNVVGFYRKELDKISKKSSSGIVTLGFNPDLEKSFNRGFTTYFLENRENCFNFDTPKFVGEKIGVVQQISKNSFKIKIKNGVKLSNQDGLLFSSGQDYTSGCLINRVENNIIYPNSMPDLKVGDIVYRNSDVEFKKSVLNSKTKRQIKVDFVYENNVLRVVDEDKNMVSLTITESESTTNAEKMRENFKKSLSKTGETDFCVKDIIINTDLPFIPLSRINEYRRIILNNLLDKRILNYKREIQKPLQYVPYYTDTLDYRGNVHNIESKMFYEKCGAIVSEPSFELQKPKRQIELMRTKHCIKYAIGKCKSNLNLFLVDEKGIKYPLKFDCANCEMAVLSPNI